MCSYDGQYFHFASGRNYIVSLLSYSVPEWRNGRRRGFKIPRLHGRVSSSLTLGTIVILANYYKPKKLHVFYDFNLPIIFLISMNSLLHYFLLIIKNTLLQLGYYMSAQFDGEEQKAGALASVFFLLPKFFIFFNH